MSTCKGWATQLIAPAVLAVATAACGGGDGRNQERQAQQPVSNAPEAQAQNMVSLSGCVEAAPGTQQFVLRNVRLEPRQGEPDRDTTTPGAQGITEGAWVRLNAADQDLASHAGQRVTIMGSITDNGQNTIGTAGTSGTPTVSGDRSQAASQEHHSDKVKAEAGRIGRESMANGTAAEVRVQQIKGTGERCQQELRPESRQ